MFSLSQKQRRRWTLPLVVVFLLHWCFGIGAAAASIICLEPNGQAAIELAGKPCPELEKTDKLAKHCIDLPADDGHQDHEPSPSANAKLPVAQAAFLLTAFPHLLPLPTTAPLAFRQILAPPATNHPAVLREGTVLRI